MRLQTLIDGLSTARPVGENEPEIADVVEDSRAATSGALFVARPGATTDGARFVADAVARGAVAVVATADVAVPPPAVHVVSADPARDGARLAERLHGEPSRRLDLVAITGTNGKTTVASLVQQILTAAGRRCGRIGTVGVDLGGEPGPHASGLTTPPAVDLSRTLAAMVELGCTACAIEASSHALEQGRVDALRVAVAVFTNLSGDHLDYHATEDDYRRAKARLFALEGAAAVINADDAAAPVMIDAARGRTVVTTSAGAAPADARATVLERGLDGARVRFEGPFGAFEARLSLVGEYNAANALQALTVAHQLGVERDDLAAACTDLAAPPGRLERVAGPAGGPTVLVDYAHTDDALENVLRAVRPAVPEGGRLRVVFGCGGDRDRTKRPRMARAAWAFADEVVVTSDNPRTEDPERIVDDVLAGVPAEHRDATHRVVDRAAAIRFAVERSGALDVVIVAGKGHETEQIIGRERRPFDDRVEAAAALERFAGVAAP